MANKTVSRTAELASEARATAERARRYRERKRHEIAVDGAILEALGSAINRADKHKSIYKFLSDLRQTAASSIEEAGIVGGKDVYNARLKLLRSAKNNDGQ